MLANAVGPALLKKGKRWYFLIADYAFGTDGHERLKRILLAQGGQEVGADLHPLGQTDYSSYLTKARNSNADVLVFSNYGPDCQNAIETGGPTRPQQADDIRRNLVRQRCRDRNARRRHRRFPVGLRVGTGGRR